MAEFTTTSDPGDFKAQEVVDYLAGVTDPAEVARVKDAEKAGQDRASIAKAEGAPPPTAPTPETEATLGDQATSTATGTDDDEPQGPKVGDEMDGEEFGLAGYTLRVISTDGLPTDASRAAEKAATDTPLV